MRVEIIGSLLICNSIALIVPVDRPTYKETARSRYEDDDDEYEDGRVYAGDWQEVFLGDDQRKIEDMMLKEIPGRFVVISFGSEGPPFDTGLDLRDDANTFTNSCSAAGYECRVWHPRNFTGEDAWAVEDHPDECWPKNPTYCHMNLGAWKLVMLERELDMLSQGDTLLYSDGNTKRSARYQDIPDWKVSSAFAFKQSKADIVMAWEAKGGLIEPLTLNSWTSPRVVRELGPPHPEHEYFKARMLNAAHILVRKTERTMTFIRELRLALSLHHNWMTSPGAGEKTQKGFQHANGEQQVLNVYLRKAVLNGTLPADWPGFKAYGHRWATSAWRCWPSCETV